MSRKALFFDVDGTLLDAEGRMPESTREAICRTRARGNLVFVNSGRIRPLARFIERFIELDGLLCGCGTEIIIGGRCIYRYTLPEKTIEALRTDYRRFDMDLLLEGPEGIGISPDLRSAHAERVAKNIRAQGGEVPCGFFGQYPVSKFCAQRADNARCQALEETYGSDFHVMFQRGFYECVPNGCNKAEAMKKTLSFCGIAAEDAYAFGDGLNDLEVLKEARHAVVMGAHAKELEPYAELITKRLEDDGIACAMQTLGLI